MSIWTWGFESPRQQFLKTLERWPRGRRHLIRNQARGDSSGVRIPLFPFSSNRQGCHFPSLTETKMRFLNIQESMFEFRFPSIMETAALLSSESPKFWPGFPAFFFCSFILPPGKPRGSAPGDVRRKRYLQHIIVRFVI